MLRQYSQILKFNYIDFLISNILGGIYLIISHGGPGARLRYLFPPSVSASESLTTASYGLEWTVDYLPIRTNPYVHTFFYLNVYLIFFYYRQLSLIIIMMIFEIILFLVSATIFNYHNDDI